jgi:protease-4
MEVKETKSRTNPFLIFLASIGGIAIFTTVIFVFIIFSFIGMFKGIPSDIKSISSSSQGIGIIEIKEIISDVEPILKNMREFRHNDNIKAVILRIDSPGGAVGASQELYEEIKRLDKIKPVVASLVNVAASGGYYSAIGARKIVSNPGTITGSIGVIMHIPNLEKLFEKIGVKETVIKSGDKKDIGSTTRALTDEEKKIMEESLKDVHNQFIQAVSQSRKIPLEDAIRLADGRIYTGKQALELKMVDELGNFSVAIDRACEYAGIKGKPDLIYPSKDEFFLSKYLVEGTSRIILSIWEKEALKTNLYYLPN